jgi:DinB superfamily
MGAKGEAFAKQFEAKVEEATALLEKLSDTDWRKTTAAEKWTVAATAHHIASSYEPVAHIIKTIAAGQALPHFTRQMLDEMNAQHAKEFADCTKPETIALHGKAAAREDRHGVHGDAPVERRGHGQRCSSRPHRRAFRQHPENGRTMIAAPGNPQ